ncbi:putative bifunctional diguanylate cyclase/phosphodiesterase [Pseudooceanicola sp. C21-150M6]|uniref:putative bifunctional diguanylate cyclase/phosphodiesterase n=1 Tax=Pseudooceanicola sp. C21-150M6 TaxID=3434355 RepID=UPI003D7F9D10
MNGRIQDLVRKSRQSAGRLLTGPPVVAFVPALALGAFWFGGEAWLIAASLTLPGIFAISGVFGAPRARPTPASDGVTGLPLRDALVSALDRIAGPDRPLRGGACFVLSLDDFDVISDRYGSAAADHVVNQTAMRIRKAVRADDIICRLGPARFGIAIAPSAHLDTERAIQLASRIQIAVEEPTALDNTVIYASASIGFCLASRANEPRGQALLDCALSALEEAEMNAPSAVRSYAKEMKKSRHNVLVRGADVVAALEAGQIYPFFQPQISTDTGLVTGMEALARWHHPDRGFVAPSEFLSVLEASGHLCRLGEVMLSAALTALNRWDGMGVDIPQVGVNFSPYELRNPKLIEKVKWELDRHGLAPERLTVEVLETVIASSPEDVVVLNVNGLSKLGCRIDLDDFGTGHASISSIRRFAVARIKIDRSFVMKVDRDPEQQRMIAAILTMSERLGLDTLAEGVETPSEHVTLAQLGCDHVQGFGIARPMPFDSVAPWVREQSAKFLPPPRIMRGGG